MVIRIHGKCTELPHGDATSVQRRTKARVKGTGVSVNEDPYCGGLGDGVVEHCAGRKTNPHLIRDMIVTHLKNNNSSDAELEALAIYMGHSVEMQRLHYDRRSKAQKVAPAVALLEQTNARITLGK
ncbi:hypothetical protein CYMTET_26845 [Cymbomonas tetramitiformis]|uniref:Uncharacterized protein n=1 Tax=Cymbomonas tetramitiformis TaxID=36881 RepID=A0AAE0FQY4_9CHLO|nr:hypothetical protein CYMTET_26845 [Cymbomonas tetramitiformis]